MGRKRREVTEDERLLWRRAVGEARRLDAPGGSVRDGLATPPGPIRSGQRPSARQAGRAAAPAAAPAPASSGLDGRTAERLRRGKRSPEARIDLHGMTAARAHQALIRFVGAASAQGMRCVLVITGKGVVRGPRLPDAAGPGVLRREAPHWLRAPPLAPLIAAVMPAHRRHGGDGALYLYLRRRR